MNYEDLYQSLQPIEKTMREKLAAAQKSFKSIAADTERGDVKNLSKDVSQTLSLLSELENLSSDLQASVENFDARQYFESGAFARQMVDGCERLSVDIKGDSPVYEIFPFKVRIDAENQDLYVNRKKVQCMRPLYFVKDIKQSREKYLKASFNVNTFLSELAAAYDTACVIKGSGSKVARDDYDLLLRDLYDYMVPTARGRRDYDLQNYAFDLARLYAAFHNSEVEFTKEKESRRFAFGSTKNPAKLIRILDENGKEQFLGTIRFYK